MHRTVLGLGKMSNTSNEVSEEETLLLTLSLAHNNTEEVESEMDRTIAGVCKFNTVCVHLVYTVGLVFICVFTCMHGSRGGQMGHLTYVKIAKQIISIQNYTLNF